ncbi:hypothetical transcript [Echinococcus multilocularis]|uniref:Hypothetical transcript n=1 Tax=Echinococcus multilocularis TaxID=6211 RepID=A0A068YMI2_ECHMU|nr:hypothetical transcript [Echinococcus multilocularis]
MSDWSTLRVDFGPRHESVETIRLGGNVLPEGWNFACAVYTSCKMEESTPPGHCRRHSSGNVRTWDGKEESEMRMNVATEKRKGDENYGAWWQFVRRSMRVSSVQG